MKPVEAKQVKVGQYIQSTHTNYAYLVEAIEESKEYPDHLVFTCTDGSRILSMDVVPNKRITP